MDLQHKSVFAAYSALHACFVTGIQLCSFNVHVWHGDIMSRLEDDALSMYNLTAWLCSRHNKLVDEYIPLAIPGQTHVCLMQQDPRRRLHPCVHRFHSKTCLQWSSMHRWIFTRLRGQASGAKNHCDNCCLNANWTLNGMMSWVEIASRVSQWWLLDVYGSVYATHAKKHC